MSTIKTLEELVKMLHGKSQETVKTKEYFYYRSLYYRTLRDLGKLKAKIRKENLSKEV